MNQRQKADNLLAALARHMNIDVPALEPDRAYLTLNLEPVPLIFALSEETGELLAVARLAPLPEDEVLRANLVCELMQGNFSWGGTAGGILGLEGESGCVCLSCRYALERVSGVSFVEKIKRQYTLAEYWNCRLGPEKKQNSGLRV
jgi:hypothetical protein